MLSPTKGLDVGLGAGTEWTTMLHGGVVGLVLDARGRPFHLPAAAPERVKKLKTWMQTMEMYPDLLWSGAATAVAGD